MQSDTLDGEPRHFALCAESHSSLGHNKQFSASIFIFCRGFCSRPHSKALPCLWCRFRLMQLQSGISGSAGFTKRRLPAICPVTLSALSVLIRPAFGWCVHQQKPNTTRRSCLMRFPVWLGKLPLAGLEPATCKQALVCRLLLFPSELQGRVARKPGLIDLFFHGPQHVAFGPVLRALVQPKQSFFNVRERDCGFPRQHIAFLKAAEPVAHDFQKIYVKKTCF